MKYNKIIAAVLFAFIFIVYFIIEHNRDVKRKENHIVGSGIITSCKILYKNGGAVGIGFKYDVGNKTLMGSASRTDIDINICESEFLGKTFPIIYPSDDITFSIMLLFPSDFKYEHVDFPDSLKWAEKYQMK